ncbi:MAG: RNA methyltransferase [Candidatus Micrarchaeia archaeon]|jgi:tRNA/rRNA methyltransferase
MKLIIVSPKYQMNVGYIARLAKNFGIEKLHIVKPRANIKGKKAIMFSKHAHALLENASIYESLENAIKGCDIVIGTTGLIKKANPNVRKFYYADELEGLCKGKNVCLVIGRDDTGLTSEELDLCDVVAYIPTSKDYPVLNISHAVAILLFLLRRNAFKESKKVEKEYMREKEILIRLFENAIKNKRIRDKKHVARIFRKIINRAEPNMHELRSLMLAFK